MEKVIARSLLLWGAIGLASPVAQAAEPPTAAAKAIAKKAYEQGTTHYKKGEWDLAIEQFELCHKSLPQPVFLFNIAQSHNKAGRTDQALTYYKRYLSDAPTAANRAEVEETVAALEKQAAPKVQIATMETYPVEVASEPPPKGHVAKPERQPISKKTWLIIAGAAGGAIVLGTVIGLSVYFGTKGPTTTVFNPVNP